MLSTQRKSKKLVTCIPWSDKRHLTAIFLACEQALVFGLHHRQPLIGKVVETVAKLLFSDRYLHWCKPDCAFR